MNTTSVGRGAEAAVAKHFQREGYKLLDQNWRTRWCEIDLVMKKDEVVYFIEVKYRKNSQAGEGLEYVTPKKIQQMNYAAEFWCSKNKWEGDCLLKVASVDGERSRLRVLDLE